MTFVSGYIVFSLLAMFLFHAPNPAFMSLRPKWFKVGHSVAFVNLIAAFALIAICGLFFGKG